MSDPYITVEDLAPYGLTVEDARRLWPHATEYVALDGRPCWCRADLDGRPADTARDSGRE